MSLIFSRLSALEVMFQKEILAYGRIKELEQTVARLEAKLSREENIRIYTQQTIECVRTTLLARENAT